MTPLLAAVLSLEAASATPAATDGPGLTWILVCSLLAVAVLGIVVFYFPLLEARFGKTLGKHLVAIRVIRENGAPIGLGQAFVRRLSFYFEMLVVDALFIPFTDHRQRALDIVAKTIVAREPERRAGLLAYLACLLLPLADLGMVLGTVALLSPEASLPIRP